jgi:hypothetical protein
VRALQLVGQWPAAVRLAGRQGGTSLAPSQQQPPSHSLPCAPLCLTPTLAPCVRRLCLQFMRSYKRNDKPVCTAAARFLGHLINQGVAHEVS